MHSLFTIIRICVISLLIRYATIWGTLSSKLNCLKRKTAKVFMRTCPLDRFFIIRLFSFYKIYIVETRDQLNFCNLRDMRSNLGKKRDNCQRKYYLSKTRLTILYTRYSMCLYGPQRSVRWHIFYFTHDRLLNNFIQVITLSC